MPTVLALGLDPAAADMSEFPQLTPEMIRAFIDAQLERLRTLGYDVVPCLVDAGKTAEAVRAEHLDRHTFDCVVIAGPSAALRKTDQPRSRIGTGCKDLLQHDTRRHGRRRTAVGVIGIVASASQRCRSHP
jgi:hypothetical protein